MPPLTGAAPHYRRPFPGFAMPSVDSGRFIFGWPAAPPPRLTTVISSDKHQFYGKLPIPATDPEKPMVQLDLEKLTERLETLRREHGDLDEVIARLAEEPAFDMIKLQRLKKRKLAIKDMITQIESQLIPDIIA